MAVRDVYYQKQFHSVTEDIVIKIMLVLDRYPWIDGSIEQWMRQQIRMRPLAYTSPYELADEFNSRKIVLDFSSFLTRDEFTALPGVAGNGKWRGRIDNFLVMEYIDTLRRFIFHLTNEVFPVMKAYVDFPSDTLQDEEFLNMIGYYREEITDKPKLTLYRYHPHKTLNAPPDFTQGTSNIWLEAPTLVGFTPFGDMSRSLLNVISIKGGNAKYLHHSFTNDLRYVPVTNIVKDDIHIKLTNDHGHVLDFNEATQETQIVLHFRKI